MSIKKGDEHYFPNRSETCVPIARFPIGSKWYCLYVRIELFLRTYILYNDRGVIIRGGPAKTVFEFLAELMLEEMNAQGQRDAHFIGQALIAGANAEAQRITAATGEKMPTFKAKTGYFDVPHPTAENRWKEGVVELDTERLAIEAKEETSEQVSESLEPAPCPEIGGERRQDARTEAGEG